ncbi:MAG: SRPBCC family protein [Acidimicrobiales bacterium]
MELNNEFKVSVPVVKAWSVLTDLERIAPCLPGAQLQEIEGDEYKGTVKVKVGPITAQYKGVARLGELDEAAGRIVLNADGRDSRGQGNASAIVTATLEAEGDGTRVKVSTELNITGKVAQMGRGVLSDVSTKLMDQFAEALEADLSSQDQSVSAPPAILVSSDTSSGPRRIESNEPEAIDLNAVAGMPVARRVGPIVGTLVVVLWLLRRRRKRRRS